MLTVLRLVALSTCKTFPGGAKSKLICSDGSRGELAKGVVQIPITTHAFSERKHRHALLRNT